MAAFSNLLKSSVIAGSNLVSWWQRRAAASVNVLEINLAGQIVEEAAVPGLMQRLWAGPFTSMRQLLLGLDRAVEDPHIKVLFLRLVEHDLGWGRADELAQAIRHFRAAGKYALAFLESGENIDTYIAAACDRIVAPPGSPLYLTGLLSEVMYFKGILDKLEIRPELFQAGKYKAAIEPYTRSTMSREHREAIESILDSIYENWTKALALARGKTPAQISRLIDQGPWLTEEAKEAGLIDALLYEDQINDYLEEWLGIIPRRISLERYLKVFGPRPSVVAPWRGKTEAIALITASGPIHPGESRYYGTGEGTVGADTLRRVLAEVREEETIKAVAIRVDSPGGSALHSDLIWREVERLKEEKPVITSMADMAASGGYYIAMPSDHIVASPLTLTGSIGVIGGRINLKGLYTKIGIKKEILKRGRHSDLVTDYGALSPELKKKVLHEMETIYRIFVDKAAKGRKREPAELEKAAQGRVWTGEQAAGLGLVDELGNLMSAIRQAKKRAGIPPSRRVRVVSLPRPRRFTLPTIPFPLPLPGGLTSSLSPFLLLEPLANTPLLALMPFFIKIR